MLKNVQLPEFDVLWTFITKLWFEYQGEPRWPNVFIGQYGLTTVSNFPHQSLGHFYRTTFKEVHFFNKFYFTIFRLSLGGDDYQSYTPRFWYRLGRLFSYLMRVLKAQEVYFMVPFAPDTPTQKCQKYAVFNRLNLYETCSFDLILKFHTSSQSQIVTFSYPLSNSNFCKIFAFRKYWEYNKITKKFSCRIW